MKIKTIYILLLFAVANNFAQDYTLKSPNEKLVAKIENNNGLRYSFSYKGVDLVENSKIEINIDGELLPSENAKIVNYRNKEINEKGHPVVPLKTAEIENHCNELLLVYANNIWIVFRAYDNGLAYRIISNFEKPIKIINETVDLNFADNFSIYFPEEESFISHYERSYKYLKLKDIQESQFCSLPALVDCSNGIKIGFTESSLYDYPNLFLKGKSSNKLTGTFPKFVLETTPGASKDRDEIITKEADYIASSSEGSKDFPWRIFMLSENDKDLIKTPSRQ